jgi:AraC-like DNA-binding protein
MIDVVRCYAGRAWTPDLILTTAPRGSPKGSLEQIVRANVSTGHDVPAIRFDTRLLARGAAELPGREHAPNRTDEPPVPAEQDELAAVIAVTGLALAEGYPRIDWVAAKLGLTRRTLQRRLGDHGTTFAQLTEGLLRENAETLLARTREPVTDIALKRAMPTPRISHGPSGAGLAWRQATIGDSPANALSLPAGGAR